MSEINEREAFEAWQAEDLKGGVNFDADSYAWDAWQARAALSASPAPSGEVEAVEVVAWSVVAKYPHREERKALFFTEAEADSQGAAWCFDDAVVSIAPLQRYDARYQRIVAAKDAEIAHASMVADDLGVIVDRLRAQLAEIKEKYSALFADAPVYMEIAATQPAAVPVGLVEAVRVLLEVPQLQGEQSYSVRPIIDRVRSALSAPAAPQQGDSVAIKLLRDLDDAWNSHDGRELFGKLMVKVEALLATPAAPQQGVTMPESEGSAAQKSFWAGFEAAHLSKSTNIREAWNRYKATDEFARLNADRSAQGGEA